MDRESILIKLKNALNTSFEESKISVVFESNDLVKIEVISNSFKNVIVTKRLDMISQSIVDIVMADLSELNFAIIALTENEEYLDMKENIPSIKIASRNDEFAARPLR